MKTVRTTDIARVIAERYDIEFREATAFVNAMVNVMNDALHYEKLVKVKGLGTFKVTTVNSRESIDVTTGERINIEARDKIAFTPDAALRDRVNAPFSQFETVVVNEGVDFSEIDANYQQGEMVEAGVEHEENERPVVESAEVEHPVVVAEEHEHPQTHVQAAPLVSELRSSELVRAEASVKEKPLMEVSIDEGPAKVGEVETPMTEKKEKDVATGTTFGTETSVETETTEEVQRVSPSPSVSSVDTDELHHLRQQMNELMELREEDQETLRRTRRMFSWLVGCLVVLLLAALMGLSYFYWHPTKVVVDEPSSTVLVPEVIEPVSADSLQTLPDTLSVAASEIDSIQMAEPVSTKKAEASSEYDSDPRIRLGAYRIVGIDRTVTVIRGQSFKMISKAHLGEGMECYMEAVNPGVKSVKEGDVLNVPKLELKRKNRQ